MRGRNKPPKERLPVGALKIERDAALIAIIGPPIQRTVRVRLVLIKRAEVTGWRPAWRLDFNDIGTEVAKNLSTQQPTFSGDIQHSIRTQHGSPPFCELYRTKSIIILRFPPS
jgi:hypothetical protein